MDIATLHPLVIHFPIALLISALAFDLVGVLWRREAFSSAAYYALLIGALGAVAAVLTGNQAEEAAERLAGIEPVLELHQKLGQVTMWAALAAVALRWYLIRRQPLAQRLRVLLLGISLALAVLVGVGGYYGGQLVYEFGAGVAPVMRSLGPAEEAP